MHASEPDLTIAAQQSQARSEALLQQVRAFVTGFELAHFPTILQQILAIPLSASQRLELQAFQVLARSLDASERPHDLLLEAKQLQLQAQAQQLPMAQAAAWRALQWIQTRMRLYHAALDSCARAGELYQRCGQPALAVQMRAMRCTVLFGSEMYQELRDSCVALLADGAAQAPQVRNLLLNYGASAAYYLALEADNEAAALPWWEECLAQRAAALEQARAAGLHYHECLALLNLAAVHATRGNATACRAALGDFHRACGPSEVQPYWRLALRTIDVLLQCMEGERAGAWQALLDFDAQLAQEPPHSSGSREIVAYAIHHYGRRWGYLEQTLQACQGQVRLERQHKRELATALGEAIEAVMERPHLLHQNAQLAQQGTALENSLAQRNLELQSALAAMQSEAAVRQQAEEALQRAHDELEEQVRQRSAELERALRTLLQQEKQLGLSRMVVGMAHEINTPLGNARMAASAMTEHGELLRQQLAEGLLKRSQLETLLEQQVHGGALLERAIRQISELVQRFKSLAGAQRQERAVLFDLRHLLERAEEQWATQLSARGVALQLQLPATLEMAGYPVALLEVFQHLLDNCLAHAYPEGRAGTIVVAAARDGAELVIDWRDDGNGIAPEHLGRVFEPFYTTQLGRTGAGLGLASVHGMVVDLMRGRITVTPAPGGGTLVRLQLPQDGDI